MTNAQKPNAAPDGPKIISFLLDESGSMESIQGPIIASFNAYLDDLKSDENAVQARFSLSTFDSNAFSRRCVAVPMADVPHLSTDTFQPGARTPLLDAIARVIRETEDQVASSVDPDVVITILTDGYENASQAYSIEELSLLIRTKEAGGWTFAYLGANQDAWEVASTMSIRRGSSASFTSTPDGVINAMRSVSLATQARYANRDRRSDQFLTEVTDERSGHLKGDDAAEGSRKLI